MNNYVTFRKFSDQAEALDLKEILTSEGIDTLVEEDSYDLDITFANNALISKSYLVKMDRADFRRAESILFHHSEALLEGLPPDYYVYDFSDEELREIVENPDEWSTMDYVLAIRLLKEKGTDISTTQIEEIKAQKVKSLSEPAEMHPGMIVTGYVLSFLGGIFGLVVGAILQQKITLPDGNTVPAYVKSNRVHGINMIGISIGMVVLLVVAYVVIN